MRIPDSDFRVREIWRDRCAFELMSQKTPTTIAQHATINSKPFWNFRLVPLLYPFKMYSMLDWIWYDFMLKPSAHRPFNRPPSTTDNSEILKRRLQQRRPHARSPLQNSKTHSKLDSFDEWKGELREGTARPPDVLVPLLGSLPPTQLESTGNKTFRRLNGFLGVEKAAGALGGRLNKK